MSKILEIDNRYQCKFRDVGRYSAMNKQWCLYDGKVRICDASKPIEIDCPLENKEK